MIELVVSLALLALMVSMMVTIFQASTRSLYDTVTTKRELNTQVSRLLLEENVEIRDSLSIQYQYMAEGIIHEDSFEAELIKAVDGSLYKFR